MILYNLILVIDMNEKNVLMCYRSKSPYKGLYNLVGGKIEENENYLDSAYRELFEETGISRSDILLKPYIDFTWHQINMKMKVFIGKLSKSVNLVDEVHKLYWIDINSNFFDLSKFAGEGNIGHMMEVYFQQKDKLFDK